MPFLKSIYSAARNFFGGTKGDMILKTEPDIFEPKKSKDMLATEPVIPLPMNVTALYLMKQNSPAMTTIINKVTMEIFRKIFKNTQIIESYCEKCGMEYEEKKEDKCDACGSTNLKLPDKNELLTLSKWKKKVNRANEMTDLSANEYFKMLNNDLEITDGFWSLVAKDYTVNENNDILDWNVMELLRGDPAVMRLVRDRYSRSTGYSEMFQRGMYTCTLHRKNNLAKAPGYCQECKRPLKACVAVALDERAEPMIGYLPGEVFYKSKYNPSEDYGFSNVVTGWILENTNLNMDLLVNITYREQRPPKGILAINTKNLASLETQLKKIDKRREQEPMHVPRIAIESDSKSGGVQWIQLTQDFSELQTLEMKADNIRRLGAMWGVLPVFMGDMSTSGGLNNEGLQVTMTLQAIESGQAFWHNLYWPWLMKQLKVKHHSWRFPKPIEKDKVSLQLRRMNNLNEMEKVLNMGGEVEIIDQEELDFTFSGDLHAPETPGEDIRPQSDFGGGDQLTTKSRLPDVGIDFRADMNLAYNSIFKKLENSLKGGVTKENAQDLTRAVVRDIRSNLGDTVYSNYAKLILKGYEDAGVDPTEADIDIKSLRAIADESPIWDSFAGLDKTLNSKLQVIITEAFAVPGEFSTKNMIDRMRKVADLETYRLENIARTETTSVVNLGRDRGYKQRDPEGNFEYKLTGEFKSNRTCDAHKWINSEIQKAGGSVSMERLEELTNIAHNRWWKTFDRRGHTIHYNQRKTVMRVVK